MLAEQLKGLRVAIDPSAAINMAWRAAVAQVTLGARRVGSTRSAETVSPRTSSVARSSSAPATGANAVEVKSLAVRVAGRTGQQRQVSHRQRN